jgi:uncharacterized protein (DUF2252 family)
MRNQGLSTKVISKKFKAMSTSPVHMHRFNPVLENAWLSVRKQCPKNALFARPAPVGSLQADSHMGNFGPLQTPRGPMYGQNDFDHTDKGSVDLDLHRLATSTVLWARDRGATKKQQEKLVRDMAASYFNQIESLADSCNPRPESLHMPNELVQRNGYIQSKLNKALADEKNHDKWIGKKLTKDADGNLMVKKTDPLCPEEVPQFCKAFKEYVSRLPEDVANFEAINVTKGRDGGGSSAGFDRYRVVLKDAQNKLQILDVKSAPAGSVNDQSGKNAFDGAKVAAFQAEVNDQDPYKGHVDYNGKSFFARVLHPHNSAEKKIKEMTVPAVNEAAIAAGGVLARSHSLAIDGASLELKDWIGTKCEQKAASDKLVKYAFSYANQVEKDQQYIKKIVDTVNKKN